MERLVTVDKNLKAEFDKIISEGEYYKQQLLEKVRELNDSDKTESAISDQIYNAWRGLEVTFSEKTQKAVTPPTPSLPTRS